MSSRSPIEILAVLVCISRFSPTAVSAKNFGLFSVGQQTPRRFGGVGLMIQSPRTRLQFSSSSRLIVAETEGDTCDNILIVGLPAIVPYCPSIKRPNELPCEIKLIAQPPRHAGFGSGTQLAFSVAVGLLRFFDLPIAQPNELAP